jgi:diguanylate cyclase (GGDEF)-like protein
VVDHLSATVREADLLGRWGGEEFVLLAPDTLHADAVALAERCRAALHGVSTDPVGVVTASFGVATLAADDDARSLMRRADLALYAAKREGRDRVVGIPDLEAARPDEGDVDADSTVELNGDAP